MQAPYTAAVAVGHAVAESYTQYNLRHCQGSDVLSACFGHDASAASYGLLRHNHLLLVLLSWLNGAMWKLTEEERQVLVTRADGRLDVEAAVAVKNLQELHKTCRECLLVEVLSWKSLWKSLGLVPSSRMH